jgi:hypothetical protein
VYTKTGDGDPLEVRRMKKVKTNVADVSSMTLLSSGAGEGGGETEAEGATRVLICGVGMEVIRLEWDEHS